MQMSTAQQNLYEVIGLSKDASQDLIDEQCIHLGERYRPDKKSGDLRRALIFAQIEKAYETLGGPIKRAAYDAELLRQRAKTIEQEFPPLFVEPTPNKKLNSVRSGKTTHADPHSRNELPSAGMAAAESVEHRYPVEFTASVGEYFRIWIVNLGLTILTLGIYSAWAKVRKKRYIYGHTRIDGDSFEYRGNPMAILKGRLIAVGAVVIVYAAGKFSPSLLWVLVIVAVCAAPWLIVRSLAFNAYNTAYRNIRLHFRGAYLKCFKIILWNGFLTFITGGFLYPYLKARLLQFAAGNHDYGTIQFQVAELTPQFAGKDSIYVRAYGLGLILFIVLFAMGVAGALIGLSQTSPELSVPTTVVGYVGSLFIFAYLRAWVANATWNSITVGPVHFDCALRPRDMFALYLINILVIIVTLGLATPWATVRTMRYRAEKMKVVAAGGLDCFVGAESTQVSAAGEEVGEMFDTDLSL